MKKAFTLIEMLVSIILLSLLIGVAAFAFRMQLISIHKSKTEGLNSIIEYTQLRSTLESMSYYAVEEYDVLGNPMKNLHYYFKGNDKSMSYITTSPIFSDVISVSRLECTSEGLLYIEEPLFENINFLTPTLLDSSHSKIFYKMFNNCKFTYTKGNTEVQKLKDELPEFVTIILENEIDKVELYVEIKNSESGLKKRLYNAMYERD
jgi:prepilin-type N-terminal cleavage/methylation domain-containing protein